MLESIITPVHSGTVTPVVSGPAADMTRVPAALRLDWLLLFVHPMADALSGGLAWAMVDPSTNSTIEWTSEVG